MRSFDIRMGGNITYTTLGVAGTPEAVAAGETREVEASVR